MNIETLSIASRRVLHGTPHAPAIPHEPPDWTMQAVCASVDPDVWFPEIGGPVHNAKRICQGCPVKKECLAYALENGEEYGVFGGLSPNERRKLARPTRTPSQSHIDREANAATPCPECGQRGFQVLAMHRLKKHGVQGAA